MIFPQIYYTITYCCIYLWILPAILIVAKSKTTQKGAKSDNAQSVNNLSAKRISN